MEILKNRKWIIVSSLLFWSKRNTNDVLKFKKVTFWNTPVFVPSSQITEPLWYAFGLILSVIINDPSADSKRSTNSRRIEAEAMILCFLSIVADEDDDSLNRMLPSFDCWTVSLSFSWNELRTSKPRKYSYELINTILLNTQI